MYNDPTIVLEISHCSMWLSKLASKQDTYIHSYHYRGMSSSPGMQVSLRDLMKAEEAEEDERRKRRSASMCSLPVQRSLSYDEIYPAAIDSR